MSTGGLDTVQVELRDLCVCWLDEVVGERTLPTLIAIFIMIDYRELASLLLSDVLPFRLEKF